MTMELFAAQLLERALSMGCEAAETCVDESRAFRVKVLDGQIDSYQVSQKIGAGLRVVVSGKNGYAYTQAAQDADALISRAMDNAKSVEQEDVHPMQTAQDYETVRYPVCPLCSLTAREKIDMALSMERMAKQADARVFQTPYCIVTTGIASRHIRNTLGLDAFAQEQSGAIALQAAVKEGEEVHDGYAFREGADAMDAQGCVDEAVQKAVDQFGASSVSAGRMRVLLDREAAAQLLSAFSGAFCADAAQKGLSPLAGREKTQIADACVSIVNDPFYEKNPRAFDGEGTPSQKTVVVQNGVFESFLHNLKTAQKAGCETTSNAERASAGSPVRVAPYNFYIKEGAFSRDDLLHRMQDGLLICEVSGLHAGLNAVTGDFSLLASGFVVKDAKRGRPVEQVTVAGNLLELLKGVRAVGNDLFLGASVVGSPSLFVEELNVSGSGEA